VIPPPGLHEVAASHVAELRAERRARVLDGARVRRPSPTAVVRDRLGHALVSAGNRLLSDGAGRRELRRRPLPRT